jgi:hypothetical protein
MMIKRALKKRQNIYWKAKIKTMNLFLTIILARRNTKKLAVNINLRGCLRYSDADLRVVRMILNRAGIMTNSEGELDDHSRTGSN